MSNSRKIEVFSAGCPLCDEAEKMVRKLSCPSCDVTVLHMKDQATIERAKQLGVQSVPAVAINDKLFGCCAGRGIDEKALQDEGLGNRKPPLIKLVTLKRCLMEHFMNPKVPQCCGGH